MINQAATPLPKTNGDMLNEEINKKSKTIIIETDYPFVDFEIHKYREYFHFNFIKNKNESMGSCLFFNRFNGRKYYPQSIEINKIDPINGRVELLYN